MVEAFFDKNEPMCLVLLLNSTGYLSVYYDWPKQAKNKGIYLIKKETKPIPKDGELSLGEIEPYKTSCLSATLVSQLSSIVLPILNIE